MTLCQILNRSRGIVQGVAVSAVGAKDQGTVSPRDVQSSGGGCAGGDCRDAASGCSGPADRFAVSCIHIGVIDQHVASGIENAIFRNRRSVSNCHRQVVGALNGDIQFGVIDAARRVGDLVDEGLCEGTSWKQRLNCRVSIVDKKTVCPIGCNVQRPIGTHQTVPGSCHTGTIGLGITCDNTARAWRVIAQDAGARCGGHRVHAAERRAVVGQSGG